MALMESRDQQAMVEMKRVVCCNLGFLGLIPHRVLEFLLSAVGHTVHTSGFLSGEQG